MGKISLDLKVWQSDPAKSCIIAVHSGGEVWNYDSLSAYLRSLKLDPLDVMDYVEIIRRFDHLNKNDPQPTDVDYEKLVELAKKLGYDGIEWRE